MEVSICIRNKMVVSNFLQLLDFFANYLYFKELGGLFHIGVFGCESTGVSLAIKCLFDISIGPVGRNCAVKIVHGD